MAAITVTAASVLPQSGAAISYNETCGATITAGQVVYRDSADSNSCKLAQANASGTATVYGIALNGGADGQPLAVITAGAYTPGGTTVQGQVYALSSAAAGSIVPLSDLNTGDYVSIIGYASNTSTIVVGIKNSGVTAGADI